MTASTSTSAETAASPAESGLASPSPSGQAAATTAATSLSDPTPQSSPSASPTPRPQTQTSTSSASVSSSTTYAQGFDDEFTGSSVDTSIWLVNNQIRPPGNGEQECYQRANVTEGGGYLAETAKVDSSCSGYAYTSGAVQTKYTFTYGTVDVRARLAGGTGPWPAIWLLGAGCQPWRMGPSPCTQWPQPGFDEIDIAEILNSQHSVVNQQIHSSAGSPGCSPTVSDTSQTWHDYKVVWGAGSLTWEIDGKVTCTQTGAVVPSHPMFLIVDTAVGGSGGGTVNNGTLPQTTSVDYVRITS